MGGKARRCSVLAGRPFGVHHRSGALRYQGPIKRIDIGPTRTRLAIADLRGEEGPRHFKAE